MLRKAINFLHIDELVCLANSISLGCDYLEHNKLRIHNKIGVSYDCAEALRVTVCAEIDSRPEYGGDSEPWVESPSMTQMSTGVIAKLSTDELTCFSNCIEMALKCYDSDFHTLIGETREFAQAFRSALEMELAKRQDRPAA